MRKEIIQMILLTIGVILAVTVVTSIDFDSDKCGWSEFNTFTNLTGGVKILNRCYVPTNHVYLSTKECGFLGILCYETEPRGKNMRGHICFKLKTGELC